MGAWCGGCWWQSSYWSRSTSPTPAAAECATFPETGKQVCDRFLEYWQQNGGLTQQGLPLSDAFVEVNGADGQPYLTQYFERVRFCWLR